jgi:hypothetical protein
MASSSANPAPPERSDVEQRRQREVGEPRGEKAEYRESFGPVTLTRHVKGDGRMLILYSRAERDQT